MDKTIHQNWSSIQSAFSANMTQLTGKSSAPFEIVLDVGLETTLRFYIYFVFAQDFCLWRTWEYKRTSTHISVPYIQKTKNRNISIVLCGQMIFCNIKNAYGRSRQDMKLGLLFQNKLMWMWCVRFRLSLTLLVC